MDLEEQILRLKKAPGKDMLVGGVDIPTQLIRLGLIDEYIFMVQPIIVGEGRRLLDSTALAKKLELKLIESKTMPSGCVAKRFVNT